LISKLLVVNFLTKTVSVRLSNAAFCLQLRRLYISDGNGFAISEIGLMDLYSGPPSETCTYYYNNGPTSCVNLLKKLLGGRGTIMCYCMKGDTMGQKQPAGLNGTADSQRTGRPSIPQHQIGIVNNPVICDCSLQWYMSRYRGTLKGNFVQALVAHRKGKSFLSLTPRISHNVQNLNLRDSACSSLYFNFKY
ncbi:hypothetical protein AVEN_232867-1, partial [Araneus ventricosus]